MSGEQFTDNQVASIRMLLEDEAFKALFPDAPDDPGLDPRWMIMTISISIWLREITGLPIDFQFQKVSQANKLYAAKRYAVGMGPVKRAD